MARDTYFVGKTDVAGNDLLEIGGSPAVEHYETLQAALLRQGGPGLADLFAEPVYRRSGTAGAPGTIAWYAYQSDTARPLSTLDDAEREAVENVLRRKLRDVMPALRDTQIGPLVGAALHIRNREDILVLGDRPLITNWGMLRDDVAHTPEARRDHFASTLGSYLPLDEAPPISSADIRAQPVEVERASAVPRGDEVALRATSVVDNHHRPDPPLHTHNGGWGWRWIPLLALIVMTLLGIVLSWWPGILLYPERQAVDAEDMARIGEEHNEALRDRRDRLRAALDVAVCTPDGKVEFPNILKPAGGEAESQTPVTPDDLIAPNPERVQVAVEDGQSTDLLSYIEARTAMVLVAYDNGVGSGSGFFITPNLFVTNAHVVHGKAIDEKSQDLGDVTGIWVKSRALAKGLPAEILDATAQSEKFGRDFALLRVAGADAPYFTIWNSTNSIKLKNVTAAGFPSAYLAIDQSRSSMYDPRSSDMPDMVMTQGTINAQQKVGSGGTLALVHSADISSGNSGGPLIDQCGRVVGVNTFGLQDDATKRWLNFSLHTAELLDFLGARGDSSTKTDVACQPKIAAIPKIARAQPEAPGPAASTPPDAVAGDAGREEDDASADETGE